MGIMDTLVLWIGVLLSSHEVRRYSICGFALQLPAQNNPFGDFLKSPNVLGLRWSKSHRRKYRSSKRLVHTLARKLHT